MQLTRQTIKEMIDLLVEYHKKDREIQDRYNQFNDIFASSSHYPVIENTLVSPIIKTFCIFFGEEFEDDIHYFLYEVPDLEQDKVIVTYENIDYDFMKKEEFVEYIISKMRDYVYGVI